MGTDENHTRSERERNLSQKNVLSPNTEGESLDLLFRVLDTQEGRLTCYYLIEQDTPISVTDLASLVAASTHETELTAEVIARTRASLSTTYLPKLEAAGLIIWDGPLVRLTDESIPAWDWLATTYDLEIEQESSQ